MTTKHRGTSLQDRLVEAYERMLGRAKQALHSETGSGLRHAIDAAKGKAVEVGELTGEEAEKIGDYVLRDVHDAATYINEQERELGDWLRLDMLLIENDLLSKFSLLVDQTKVELRKLALDAQVYGQWKTGEVTGPGTLQCVGCDEVVTFTKVSHIPPCPKCHGTSFRRVQVVD